MVRTTTTLAALALAASAVPASAQLESFGQVAFENRTDTIGSLYVDNEFGCGPVLPNLYCVTQVHAGDHSAFVKFDDGEIVTFEAFYVEPGEVSTLTVTMAPPEE